MIKSTNSRDFEVFLLNPFHRVTYIGENIFQKYPITQDIDHVVLVDRTNYIINIGYIVYSKQRVVIDKLYTNMEIVPGNKDFAQKEPFVKVRALREEIIKDLAKDVEQIKLEKLKEIKKEGPLKEAYDLFKCVNFEKIVLSKLCGMPHEYKGSIPYISYIRGFLMDMDQEDLALFLSEPEIKDNFIKELSESDNFKTFDVFETQIEKDTNDYIEARHFTDHEILVNRYLSKVEECGAKRFLVFTTSGENHYCINAVTQNGEVPLQEDQTESIKIKDIDHIKYRNKIIYKKNSDL